MIRFLLLAILILLIARTFWKVVDGIIDAAGGTTRRTKSSGPVPVKLVKDPVCGTWVPPGGRLSAVADGSTYYFCSERCRDTFGTAHAIGGRR